nr:MAG TPA: hypothetical protein [Caudoviricetes sp.]
MHKALRPPKGGSPPPASLSPRSFCRHSPPRFTYCRSDSLRANYCTFPYSAGLCR